MTNGAGPLQVEEIARRPRILLAEDDSAAAGMLQILLHSAGYDVSVAEDGLSAMRRLEESPLPDIVLLDWMLPELTGLEICRRIRARRDALSLPVLMVTARADSASITEAFEAGANDYITKPFLGAELRARIAAHLRVKQLSEEHRELDERLMERDKLSTLGLLVSGVAHDLNNPLGGIYGWAQLLLEQESDSEKLMALQGMIAEVKRCNRIVSDLLSFARRQTPERYDLDVGDVLTQTLELREKHLRGHGIVPRLRIESGLPLVYGDPHQLQQVFVNILVNAEHALRDAGHTLLISADLFSGRDTIHGDRIAVRFFNDGPPIPHEVMNRIFDPFFTTKSSSEGTGLGLAICRRVVGEHGGDIEVESTEEGTTFTILLPAAIPGDGEPIGAVMGSHIAR